MNWSRSAMFVFHYKNQIKLVKKKSGKVLSVVHSGNACVHIPLFHD